MSKLSKFPEKILKYLLSALFLAIPLYPKFPFLRIPGTYVSIRLEDFLLAFIALTTLIVSFKDIKEFFKNGLERRIFLFLGIGFVSLISGIFLTKTVSPSIGILHWLRRIEYIIPFFAVLALLKKDSKGFAEYVIKLLLIDLFVIFVWGLGQRYLSWPVIITQNQEFSKGIALFWNPGSHINSTFAGHYDLATFLILILPIFLSLLVTIRSNIWKIILGISLLMGYWLLNVAVSRISILSFLVAGIISLFLVKRSKLTPVFLVLSVLIFGFSSDLRLRYNRIIEVTRERVKKLIIIPRVKNIYAESVIPTPVENRYFEMVISTPTPEPVFEDRSSNIRLVMEWPRALRALSKNPFLGTGYSSITLATDNDFLRMLGETGILGFSSFVLIIISLGAIIFKSFKKIAGVEDIAEKSFLAGFIGGFVGVLINAVFIDIFEASKFAIIFWAITGIAVFLMRKINYEQNN